LRKLFFLFIRKIVFNEKQLFLSTKMGLGGIAEVRIRVLANEVDVDVHFPLDAAHGVRDARLQKKKNVVIPPWSQ
jgi:hypothetical protein